VGLLIIGVSHLVIGFPQRAVTGRRAMILGAGIAVTITNGPLAGYRQRAARDWPGGSRMVVWEP
jgi:hypothetical protein